MSDLNNQVPEKEAVNNHVSSIFKDNGIHLTTEKIYKQIDIFFERSENDIFSDQLKKTLTKMINRGDLNEEDYNLVYEKENKGKLYEFIRFLLENAEKKDGNPKEIITRMFNERLLSVIPHAETEININQKKIEGFGYIFDLISNNKDGCIKQNIELTENPIEHIINENLNETSEKNNEEKLTGKLLFNKENGLEGGVDEIIGLKEFNGRMYLHFIDGSKQNYIDNEGNLLIKDWALIIKSKVKLNGKEYLNIIEAPMLNEKINLVKSKGNPIFNEKNGLKGGVDKILGERTIFGKEYIHFRDNGKENFIDNDGNLLFNENNGLKDRVISVEEGITIIKGKEYLELNTDFSILKKRYLDSNGIVYKKGLFGGLTKT